MTAASLVAFCLVFLGASLAASLLLCSALLLAARRLRRMGPWVERRAAAAALLLPPLLGLGLAAVLAGESARALSAGSDHCLEHGHHLHLCLVHGAAWGSRPFALAALAAVATFVCANAVRSLWAHWRAQAAATSLRRLGEPLAEPRCFLVPSPERFAFTAGLLSPTVLLSSAAYAALDPEERRAVLAHELAHLAHRDLWHRAALGLLACLGVPYLAQRALRTWALAAERICDRHAALTVGRPSTVASAILALVRAAPARLAPEAAAFAAQSHVQERVRSLLREEHGGERSSRKLLLAAAAASLLFAAACAAFAQPLHHALETLLG